MTISKSIAIAAALLGLAACSRTDDEPAPTENVVEAPLSAEPEATEPPPAPEPTASTLPDRNLTAETPPAVAPAPDEQMMDDASATGMTARASRDEQPAETAPAAANEQQ